MLLIWAFKFRLVYILTEVQYQKISSVKAYIMVMEGQRRLMKTSFRILAQTRLPRDRPRVGFLVQIKIYKWQKLLLHVSDDSVMEITSQKINENRSIGSKICCDFWWRLKLEDFMLAFGLTFFIMHWKENRSIWNRGFLYPHAANLEPYQETS